MVELNEWTARTVQLQPRAGINLSGQSHSCNSTISPSSDPHPAQIVGINVDVHPAGILSRLTAGTTPPEHGYGCWDRRRWLPHRDMIHGELQIPVPRTRGSYPYGDIVQPGQNRRVSVYLLRFAQAAIGHDPSGRH